MGIAYCLIRAAPETVAVIANRSRAVAEFVYQDPDVYEAPKVGLFGRLFGQNKSGDTPVPERRKGDEIDLDKAWHIIHYLLSGSVGRGEGALALIGDDLHPIADLNLGLGRPNLISPEDVNAFALSAEKMSDEDFFARFDPEKMPLEELYLGEVIARGDFDDMREYSLEYFHALRTFTKTAAAEGEAIITYYT